MAEICQNCKLPHAPAPDEEGLSPGEFGWAQAQECIDAQKLAMRALLANIGDAGICRGCQAPIAWVTHRNGKKTPYTPAGIVHFIDCPERAQFAKKP